MTDVLDQLAVLENMVRGARAKIFVRRLKNEIERLRALAGMAEPPNGHWDGCWRAGAMHYECARRRLEMLEEGK